MDDIYNTLNNYLKTSSKNGINESIAHFMLVRLFDISQMRAADVAEQCHTSAPSVVRFCRELGYAGFIEFKDAVDDCCQGVQDQLLVPHTPLKILGSEEEYIQSLEEWTRLMQEFALCTMIAIDREQLIRLAQETLQYRHVYIFGAGLSAQIADQLRIQLARSGKIVMTMATPHMDIPLTESKKDTLAIIFSQHGRIISAGYGNEKIFDYLKKHCDKTWLITQEPPQHRFQVDETLYISSSSSFAMEYHTMIYFEEMLSQCCREMLTQE